MNCKIAVVGANGSGKTTLGARLAELAGARHMDIEDYYFNESAVPYACPRSTSEVQELLAADIKKFGRFVLSAVNCDFGEEINAFYNGVVYIKVPLEIRLERVRKRSAAKFGARILEGGDMYEQEQNFFQFVASRTMEQTEAWLRRIRCPVMEVDGTQPVERSARLIIEWIGRQQ